VKESRYVKFGGDVASLKLAKFEREKTSALKFAKFEGEEASALRFGEVGGDGASR
jgi:hypothetical protein